MFVTLLIGYLAAWRHDEDGKTATALNNIVMIFTLPLSLFASTVTISRDELAANLPIMPALFVGLLVPIGAQPATIVVAMSGLATNLMIVPIGIVLLTLAAGNSEVDKTNPG